MNLPGYTPPHLTYGYVGGNKPLTLVTHQDPFRVVAAQTVETELPQPGKIPRGTQDAPMPPLNGGPRRPPDRADTGKTLISGSESPSQLQPQNIIPMPHPSPTSIRFRTPGSDEDVDKPAAVPTSRHWSGHANSDQYAADYSYRSDTVPSLPPDSGPSHYKPTDISGGTHAQVWPIYNKASRKLVEKLSDRWNDDLDVLLIFAGLFSAVVTAFLTTSLGDLQPNYQQQSALLLYQLLNGRDPSLASLSDPTALFKPSALAIAVNCLWFASLSISLGVCFGAVAVKHLRTEYDNVSNPIVDLVQACRRQANLMTFLEWNVHGATLLPPLFQLSILLFFAGASIFLWQINTTVAVVYLSIGVIFSITYLFRFPAVSIAPFRPYSILIIHRLFIAIGKIVISAVDRIAHGWFIVRRRATRAILWPFARTILSAGTLRDWCKPILPWEYKHIRVRWGKTCDQSLDRINISPQVQEEAILWLTQLGLDDPSKSDVIVSSLAQMSPSRPHKFRKRVVVFLNSALESACREAPSRARIDSVLVLGRIKYQSVVDQNRDEDHVIRDIPVTALVAYAAQQLTISAFEDQSNTPHTEGIRARLLAAAAWLSPVKAGEEVTPEGERLTIQDRWEFVKQIGTTFMQHIRGKNPPDNWVLVDLIHGMHASIPRGGHGTPSSIIPFPLLTYEDYSSPWSKDESVLRALITYALDLLSYTKRKEPLVERKIKFDELALELIDALMAFPAPGEVAVFGFWLIHHAPYAFKSRKSILVDIVEIWTLTSILGDHRKQLNFHAINAFVLVARCRLVSDGRLPKLAASSVLDLLRAALEDSYNQPVVTYALALILNLGTRAQAATLSRGIGAESFANTLQIARRDPERNTPEEDLNLYIYKTLLLLKLRQPSVDIEVVKTLIEDVVTGLDRVSAGDPKDKTSIDNGRAWKAIYLSGLLARLLPPGEREGPIEALRGGVRKVLQTGRLPLTTDYKCCLEPLDVGPLKFPAEREGALFTTFEAWVDGFPLLPLAGSVLSGT